MQNLKHEIIEMLKNHGKSVDDVIWAGCEKFKIPLEHFWKRADTLYDENDDITQVAQDLIIVGKDFWIERRGFADEEWFEYKKFPQMPETEIAVDCLTVTQCDKKYSHYSDNDGFREVIILYKFLNQDFQYLDILNNLLDEDEY